MAIYANTFITVNIRTAISGLCSVYFMAISRPQLSKTSS